MVEDGVVNDVSGGSIEVAFFRRLDIQRQIVALNPIRKSSQVELVL